MGNLCTCLATGQTLATDHHHMNGWQVPVITQHQTYKYLGLELTPNSSWAVEKQHVRARMQEYVSALKGSPYLLQQLDQVVWACLLPIFRYGVALVNWTDHELDMLTNKWAHTWQLVWKLAPGSPNALHLLSLHNLWRPSAEIKGNGLRFSWQHKFVHVQISLWVYILYMMMYYQYILKIIYFLFLQNMSTILRLFCHILCAPITACYLVFVLWQSF